MQRWSLALSASRGSLGNQCGVENIVDNLRRPRIRPILKDFGQCIWRIDGRILEHALHQKSSRLTHCWRRSDPEDSHDRVPIQRQRFGSKRWVLAQNVVNTLRESLERRQTFGSVPPAPANVCLSQLQQLLEVIDSQSSGEPPNLRIRPTIAVFEPMMLHQHADLFNRFSRKFQAVEYCFRDRGSDHLVLGKIEAAIGAPLRSARPAYIVKQSR